MKTQLAGEPAGSCGADHEIVLIKPARFNYIEKLITINPVAFKLICYASYS